MWKVIESLRNVDFRVLQTFKNNDKVLKEALFLHNLNHPFNENPSNKSLL